MGALRVGFAGTPAFAARVLQALVDAGFRIPLVLVQPDRPKGRGLKVGISPVKALASSVGLHVLQPATLKSRPDHEGLLAIPLDVVVVAAYGLILPGTVLRWPRHGCINVHASRLPRWRGAAPIARAIEAGDAASGVSIMQMDAGLDTGPVIECVDVPIGPRETSATLQDRLAEAGAEAIVTVLRRLERDGALASTPQAAEGVTYATKIGRRDAAIDWTRGAGDLDRRVRAYDPTPGAHAMFGHEPFKIWRSMPLARVLAAEPGEVVARSEDGVDVACGPHGGAGTLRLLDVQPSGGRRMSAAAYAAGRGIAPGARFGAGGVDGDSSPGRR